MKVTVTGGAGFLGQYLVQELAQAGHDVSIICRNQPRWPIVDLAALSKARHEGIDITDPAALHGRFDGADIVFHLAGLVSFLCKDKKMLHAVNVGGTQNVVAEAGRAGVKRFVHVSSVAAIGYSDDPLHPANERLIFDWSNACWKQYMFSKYLAEEFVKHAGTGGMQVLIANPSLMWGPGDDINSIKLIRGLQMGIIPACPPGGTNIVDVRDVAKGLLALIEKGHSGERYILGNHNVTFRQAYDTICKTVRVPEVRFVLPRFLRGPLTMAAFVIEVLSRQSPQMTADTVDSAFRFRYFDSAKAQRELHWNPTYSLQKTIRDSVEWLRMKNLL